MPQYFFHLRVGEKLKRDKRGVELPTVKAAFHEGERIAREIIQREGDRGKSVDDHQLEIVDANGGFLFRIPLKFDFL